MAENSAIEWTDHTFNPWECCQKVGPGCDHCYAETRNARFGGGEAPNWGPGAPRRRTSISNWRKPLAWQADAARFFAEHGRRQRVFCASLADVFDNAVDPAWREDLFELIRATPDLDWLLLTKRIGNVAEMSDAAGGLPANVWLGATVVNQAEADRDIPKLDATGDLVNIRFLSIEPLIGPISISWDWLHGIGGRNGIDWVIVGGESGPGARTMHPDWARSLRDQCAAAGVPMLFKQWGEWEASLDRERDDPDWRADYSNDYANSGRSAWLNLAGGIGFHGERFHVMRRMGKKLTGRLLDGVTHDGFPS